MSVYDVLTLALEAVRTLALTAQEAQANSVKAGNDWASAAQEAGVFATAGSAATTAYAFGWITVITEGVGDDLARVAELLAAEVSTYPTCEHCGSPDLHAHYLCERCRHSSGPFEVVGILEYDASPDELLYPAWTERPYGYADEDGDRDG